MANILFIPLKVVIVYITIRILFLPGEVSAASINLSDPSVSDITDPNQEYQVNADLSINAGDGTVYYLRGVFYKMGSSNYCGYTWNGNFWFNGPFTSNDGWKNLLPAVVSSSSAQVVIRSKLDPVDSGCSQNGDYKFKIQRYTQAGSGSFDDQNEQAVSINIPSPTPTQMPIPSSTLKPQPTDSPSSTPTPIPKNTAISKPPVPTLRPPSFFPDDGPPPTGLGSKESILGIEISSTPAMTVKVEGMRENKISLPMVFLFLGGGAACTGLSVYLSVRNIRRRRVS